MIGLDARQRIEKIICKNAFEQTKKKPTLKFNPWLVLIGLWTTGAKLPVNFTPVITHLKSQVQFTPVITHLNSQVGVFTHRHKCMSDKKKNHYWFVTVLNLLRNKLFPSSCMGDMSWDDWCSSKSQKKATRWDAGLVQHHSSFLAWEIL